MTRPDPTNERSRWAIEAPISTKPLYNKFMIRKMATPSPRLVTYPSPHDFLKAVLPLDNWHLNIPIGHACRFLRDVEEEHDKTLWLTVWTDDTLDMLLTRAIPVVSLNAQSHTDKLPSSWIAPRMALLVDELHRLLSTSATAPLTSVAGPAPLVHAFVARWETLTALGRNPELGLDMSQSHLPLSHLPSSTRSPQPLPTGHSFRLLSSPESTQALAEMMQEFTAVTGRVIPFETLFKVATSAVKHGEVLGYMIDSGTGEDLAGYVRTGRITLRHGAITNVFVRAQYRRMGIAESLTRAAVMRLLSEPHPLKDELARLTTVKAVVQDIVMFAEISNLSAQGIYRRAGLGFNVGEGEWQENGEKSWEHCIELHYS